MSRATRMATYVREMFPPAVMVPSGVANALAIHLGLQALAKGGGLRVTWRLVLAALSVVLTMLLLRVYDELKDAASDAALARAGDPRFASRPVVDGRVTLRDVVTLRWLVTALLVIVNGAMVHPLPWAAFALLMAAAWGSLNWFFWPAVSRSLLLAFATHNPISLVVSAYVVAVYVADEGWGNLPVTGTALVVGLWLPVAAWEIARKIRLPADETEYETYSRRLGMRPAALLVAALAGGCAGALFLVSRAAGLGIAYDAALALVTLLLLARVGLLVARPTPARAALRPFAELLGAVATGGLLAAAVVSRGVTFG